MNALPVQIRDNLRGGHGVRLVGLRAQKPFDVQKLLFLVVGFGHDGSLSAVVWVRFVEQFYYTNLQFQCKVFT